MIKALRRAAPSIERGAWLSVGVLALGLGGLGAVLPVIPTTPFVILAAFAFGKSSPGLQTWLEQTRVFGPAIREWRARGAIALRFKLVSIVMMAGVFGLSLALSIPITVLVIQLAGMAAATAFILTRPGITVPIRSGE